MRLLWIFAVVVGRVSSIDQGFEQYSNLDGTFWAFNADGVTVVDPSEMAVVTTIPTPSSKWGDIAYIRDQAEIKHYVFANDNANGKVLVYDSKTNQFLTQVLLEKGAKPQPMYAVYYYDEVWSHDDTTGTFSIFRLPQVRFRSASGVRANPSIAGSGRLLVNPNLEDCGFSTSVSSNAIYKIDIRTRQWLSTTKLIAGNNTNGIACVGTSGIAYNPSTNRLQVECINPSTCNAATGFKDPSLCTGSIWGVNAATLQVTARLISPYLSQLFKDKPNGKYFGIQGRPRHSPEWTFQLISNEDLSVVHFLYPTADKTYVIDLPIEKPGRVKFYPKNSAIAYGLDRNASNYWAIIPIKTGVAFLDMATVVKAFAKGVQVLDTATVVTYVDFDTGGAVRPIERGGDYVIGPTYTSTGVATGLVFIDLRTHAIAYSLPGVGKDASRFQWVPYPVDETQTANNQRFATVEADVNDLDKKKSSNRDIAIAGVVLGAIGCALSTILSVVLGFVLFRSKNVLYHTGNALDVKESNFNPAGN